MHQSGPEAAAAERRGDAEVEAEERRRVRDAGDEPDQSALVVAAAFRLFSLLFRGRNSGCPVEKGEPGREKGGRSRRSRKSLVSVFFSSVEFVKQDPDAVPGLVAEGGALEPFRVVAVAAFVVDALLIREAELVDCSDLFFILFLGGVEIFSCERRRKKMSSRRKRKPSPHLLQQLRSQVPGSVRVDPV